MFDYEYSLVGNLGVISSWYTAEEVFPWKSLHWRHNEHDSVSNHQAYDCLLNRLFRYRSKKTSKLCVTGLCEGNSPVTGEFPAQKASDAEYVFIRWRHQKYFLILFNKPIETEKMKKLHTNNLQFILELLAIFLFCFLAQKWTI